MSDESRVVVTVCEETELHEDEKCQKRFREEHDDDEKGNKQDDASCRVCFGAATADDLFVARNCTWSQYHWVHTKCHAGLVKNNQHLQCTACLNPTKLVRFEKETIRKPNNVAQIRSEYMELARYLTLDKFHNQLFAVLLKPELRNAEVMRDTVLPYECVSPVVDWSSSSSPANRRYRTSNKFAAAFPESSLTEKVFMSEDCDLIVDFLRRYYHLLLYLELNHPGECSHRIMHHVLGIGYIDIVRTVVKVLVNELGHNVTSVSVLEHVGTATFADDWSILQEYYDCLGMKLTSKEAASVLRVWPVHPSILRHVLSQDAVVTHGAKLGIWSAYLLGQVTPLENRRVETWTVLMDLARPRGWFSDTWCKTRIPEDVWSKYRPEYCIPGCTGPITVYPISCPHEAMLYRWDAPWDDCSAVFCHERGLPASEMDTVIESKWVFAIRDPKQGLCVLGFDAIPQEALDMIRNVITLESNLRHFAAKMSPPPTELLKLGAGETARVRIKYSKMLLFEVDHRGQILRTMKPE